MKTYRVEVIHETNKHAQKMIEASSEKEAIEIARRLEWKDFDNTSASNQTLWKAYPSRSLFQLVLSMFGGK